MTRHLLEVDDLGADGLRAVLDASDAPVGPTPLAGKGVALLFEKPSNRTRNSSEMAVVQLGGHPVSLQAGEVGMGGRETIEDVTRTLACYHAVIGARVFAHSTLEAMAAASPVPIVNLLSDLAHPCQAVADLLTIRQRLGAVESKRIAFVGDANNVWRSLAIGAALLGAPIALASPPGYAASEKDIDMLRALGAEVLTTDRPAEAVEGADVVATDVWTSMGQEAESAERLRAFEGFIVDEKLMTGAAPGAIFLHCLPAHRGEEVAAEVIDGPQSAVWLQAENRMHAMRGIFRWLLEDL